MFKKTEGGERSVEYRTPDPDRGLTQVWTGAVAAAAAAWSSSVNRCSLPRQTKVSSSQTRYTDIM